VTDSPFPTSVRSVLVALAAGAVVLTWFLGRSSDTRSVTPGGSFRAFTATSFWNTPLPSDAPRHPDSDEIIRFLERDNAARGCVLLSGVEGNPWGTPVYWVDRGDPTFDVVASGHDLPPEFAALRISEGARPMRADDREMVVFDRDKGYVAWLHEASYDAEIDRWSASGGSVAYLESNGLENEVEGGDSRNTGSHRGLNGAVVAARLDEVRAGAIEHVLRIGVNTAHRDYIWPMSGSDGTATERYAPPQGARLRIKQWVDLDRYDLHPEALVIARALQKYGAIVGDSTGGPLELKLEDTVAEGRGQLWSIDETALCAIPIKAFEVIRYDYR
jgi:hypothetical protein